VRQVVTLHQQVESLAAIADVLGLSEAQDFHALSYFSDHQDEINALIAADELARARISGK
jgi:hypothetical protein